MIYQLALILRPLFPIFNVFHYVSFRAIAAFLTSLSLSLILGPWFIKLAGRLFRSNARPFTPASQQNKNAMPTMGGILIIVTVLMAVLLWANLKDPHIWIALTGMVLFGLIGLFDDAKKITHKRGISSKLKFSLQILGVCLILSLWKYSGIMDTHLCLPFLKYCMPSLGLFFLLWAGFVIVGTSNAVNLTDGLDGLAIGSLLVNFGVYSIIAYLAGHQKLAEYLQIPFVGTSELPIVGSSLVGASLGFLWFNTYPAQLIMGDVGSLGLGAVLALIALMTKHELLLLIVGGLFVIETLSVIIQVLSLKYIGRRFFRMAPIHHHFELMGWPESRITVRFSIISIILGLIALMTLKLR